MLIKIGDFEFTSVGMGYFTKSCPDTPTSLTGKSERSSNLWIMKHPTAGIARLNVKMRTLW